MPTIDLRPVILPDRPLEAMELLLREIKNMYAGRYAIAPVRDHRRIDSLPTRVDSTIGAVLSTSGSSGLPKETLLPVSALRASATATSERLGGEGDWMLCVPPSYVARFQVLSRAVLGGRRVSLMPPEGGFSAANFVASAKQMRPGRRYVSLVPTQLRRLLGDPEAEDELARFDAVLVGGAAMRRENERRAREIAAVHSTYGMTETCGGCVYDGRPLDGVKVKMVGETIHLGGEVVAAGYLEEGTGVGQPFYTAGDERWFITSDRGRLEGGKVLPLGRVDDLINTGGIKVSADAVTEAVRGVAGVDSAVVLGVPDPEWGERVAAYVVCSGDSPDVEPSSIQDRVRDRLGAESVPKTVVVAQEIPLLSNSKIDRLEVRRRLQCRLNLVAQRRNADGRRERDERQHDEREQNWRDQDTE